MIIADTMTQGRMIPLCVHVRSLKEPMRGVKFSILVLQAELIVHFNTWDYDNLNLEVQVNHNNQCFLFQNKIKYFFDPENIFLDNKNNYFSGWANR